MGMATNEAIEILRTESVEIGGNAVSVARFLTALDVAVKALADVPDTDVGKNEPLTLDELRDAAETGDPVWIVGSKSNNTQLVNGWVVIERVLDDALHQYVDYAEFGSDEPFAHSVEEGCVSMTNAQRIRTMSDEEMAGFLMKLMHNNVQCFGEGMFPYHPCPQEQNCKQCGLDWLQQPAEEDGHDERKENENV